MADTAAQDLQTYNGNCHCGAVKYTVTLPTITTISECNCSICHHKGYAWVFPPPDGVTFEEGRGLEKLKEYEFGSKTMVHRFCPTCGTGIMGKRYDRPPGRDVAINVRALNDVDVWSLKVNKFEGSAIKPAYVPHPHTGPEPEGIVENGKLYTGSCHCGSTTVAFKSKGELSEGKEQTMECNCSICIRNATVFAFPTRSEVVISSFPSAPLTAYTFGGRHQEHCFCPICGVSVCIRKLPDVNLEKFSLHPAMREFTPEQRKAVFDSWKDTLPVNVRCLDGLEWGSFEVGKADHKDIEPRYQVPA